ncbi:TPA: FdtA/QdtA family cupin domain-containing protein [Escherichia coli]|uniref:FdtA/QdtA family cupin domain-containing protein n=1 Tax=Escherichia coli TaxID=562 RepID=A0AAD2GK60_ECOLX|nr:MULTISPECIES: FdtA/QdtA family cupin domain-containing protein [Escherichia]EAA5571516.1 WxcM-like domain-containing protein [Escherichia coli]EAB6055871.1 WxcM-like domain-containing protein [Escherichia coli]EEQ2458944.1 WxcM-like domain-containing protein [Escherichia coli]EEU9382239.1 WxcM-like domain-containing protein [Escherichia coli]EEV5829264.1 WxcM-like domain-containing protein [Escherichia coli]
MKTDNYKCVEFNVIENDSGSLISIEREYLPFIVKRAYYIYNVKENKARGFHAHKNLEQLLICVNGSCEISVCDGKEKKLIKLDNPYVGLYLKGLVWREMYNFTRDAVLLVLASDVYDELDYIRDYSEFMTIVNKETCR